MDRTRRRVSPWSEVPCLALYSSWHCWCFSCLAPAQESGVGGCLQQPLCCLSGMLLARKEDTCGLMKTRKVIHCLLPSPHLFAISGVLFWFISWLIFCLNWQSRDCREAISPGRDLGLQLRPGTSLQSLDYHFEWNGDLKVTKLWWAWWRSTSTHDLGLPSVSPSRWPLRLYEQDLVEGIQLDPEII